MLDTLNWGHKIQGLSQADISEFCRKGSGNAAVISSLDKETGEHNAHEWRVDVPGIGPCRLHRNGGETGYLAMPFWALPRWYEHLATGNRLEDCHNDRVLTAEQANDTFQAITVLAERTFDMLEPGGLSVSRADVVYQRQVGNSMDVLTALYGAIKPTSKGSAWFDNRHGIKTGLVLRGLEVVHRVYDKGLESGHVGLRNVLRSEEQLRNKAAAFGRIVDVESRTFDREECLNTMNKRYLESTGTTLDVAPLVANEQYATALFVLHPELLDIYRSEVKRETHSRMRSKVRKIRAAAVPYDMSVPEDAWL